MFLRLFPTNVLKSETVLKELRWKHSFFYPSHPRCPLCQEQLNLSLVAVSSGIFSVFLINLLILLPLDSPNLASLLIFC